MAKSTCSVEGCENPSQSRDLCPKHYQRWRATADRCSVEGCTEPLWKVGLCVVHGKRYYKTGDVGPLVRRRQRRFVIPHLPQPGFLWCRECAIEMPFAEFPSWSHDRPVSFCRRCAALKSAAHTHHTTTEHLRKLLDSQGHACAICKQPESKRHAASGLVQSLSVDHDHSCCPGKGSCGKCIRGFLCDSCNTVLGRSNDDLIILRNAIAYIELFQAPGVGIEPT